MKYLLFLFLFSSCILQQKEVCAAEPSKNLKKKIIKKHSINGKTAYSKNNAKAKISKATLKKQHLQKLKLQKIRNSKIALKNKQKINAIKAKKAIRPSKIVVIRKPIQLQHSPPPNPDDFNKSPIDVLVEATQAPDTEGYDQPGTKKLTGRFSEGYIPPKERKELKGNSNRFDFNLNQFSEEEKDVLTAIEKGNFEEINNNLDIIFKNSKISLIFFMKANEYRGTFYSYKGIQMMEKIYEKNPSDPIVAITLANFYFENKQFYKSKEILNFIEKKLNNYSQKEVIKYIEVLKSKINSENLGINGGLGVSYGFDDNPQYTTNSNLIKIFNLSFAAPTIHSDFMTGINGNLNYRAFVTDNVGFSGYMSTNMNIYNKTDSRNMLFLSTGNGLSLKYGKLRLDVLGNYNSFWIDKGFVGGFRLENYGATTNLSYVLNRYLKIGTFFTFSNKNFSIIPEKNSKLYSVGISLTWVPTTSTLIALNLGNNAETAALNSYSNNSFFTSLMVNQIITQYVSVTASLFYSNMKFKAVDPILLVTRNDNMLMFQLAGNYHISKNFTLSVIYARTQNFSNTELYTYKRNAITLALAFKF